MQFIFPAIGTKWIIDIFKGLSKVEEEKISILIKNRIDLFDIAYSRFREDSLVTKISKKVGEYILPEDAKPMMDL